MTSAIIIDFCLLLTIHIYIFIQRYANVIFIIHNIFFAIIRYVEINIGMANIKTICYKFRTRQTSS